MNGILHGDGVQSISIQHMSILSKNETYKDPQTTYKEPYKWALAQVCEADQGQDNESISCCFIWKDIDYSNFIFEIFLVEWL